MCSKSDSFTVLGNNSYLLSTLELMEILLENGILTYDSLLLAIEEEYVEGVEILLEHEERIWKRGTPHSWEVRNLHVSPKIRTSLFELKFS